MSEPTATVSAIGVGDTVPELERDAREKAAVLLGCRPEGLRFSESYTAHEVPAEGRYWDAEIARVARASGKKLAARLYFIRRQHHHCHCHAPCGCAMWTPQYGCSAHHVPAGHHHHCC